MLGLLRQLLRLLADAGAWHEETASVLLEPGRTPSAEIVWPKYCTDVAAKMHLPGLRRRFASRRR